MAIPSKFTRGRPAGNSRGKNNTPWVLRSVRFSVRCHVPMQRRRHLVNVNFNRTHFDGKTERKKINFELCKKDLICKCLQHQMP